MQKYDDTEINSSDKTTAGPEGKKCVLFHLLNVLDGLIISDKLSVFFTVL